VHEGKRRWLDGCAVDLGTVTEAYHGLDESHYKRAMSRQPRSGGVSEAYNSSSRYESGLLSKRVRSKSSVAGGLQRCPDSINGSCSPNASREAKVARSIRRTTGPHRSCMMLTTASFASLWEAFGQSQAAAEAREEALGRAWRAAQAVMGVLQ
jgi:hypothetical protein